MGTRWGYKSLLSIRVLSVGREIVNRGFAKSY